MQKTQVLVMFSGLMILAAVLLAFPGGLGRVLNAVAAADSNSHGFDLADLDTTCNACQDFFQYANGGWIKRNPIPPEYRKLGPLQRSAEPQPGDSATDPGSRGRG